MHEVYEKYNILQDKQIEKLGVMPMIEEAFAGETVFLPPLEYNATDTMRKLDFTNVEGRKRWIQAQLYPLKNTEGKLLNVIFMSLDITEHERADLLQNTLYSISEAVNQTNNLEELLTKIHEALGTLIDTTNFYVALYDNVKDEYSFPYCVDQYDDTDFTPQQLKKSLTDYVRRNERPFIIDEKIHKELISSGEVKLIGSPSPVWMGIPLKTPNGIIGVVVIQSYNNPNAYFDEDLDILSFASDQIALAIERKRTEQALKESEDKYKNITERYVDAIYVIDNSLLVTYVSPSMEINFGYKPEDLLGKSIFNFIPSEVIDEAKKEMQTVLQGNKLENNSAQMICADGSIAELEVNVVPIYREKIIVGAQGTIRNVTEKNVAQRKLAKAEAEYRNLFESAPVSIWRENFSEIKKYIDLLKEQGVIDFEKYFDNNPDELMKCINMINCIDVNDETVKLLNAQNKEEILTSLNKVFTIDSMKTFKHELLCLIAGKTKFTSESTHRTFDNKIINIMITVSLDTTVDDWSRVLISIVDITKLKTIEKTLKESEEKYRDLFDESIAAIYLFDSEKNFIDSNQAGLDLLGYTRDELLKLSIPDVDAEPIEVMEAHQELEKGYHLVNFEHRLKRKDGTIFTVLNNSKSITDKNGNIVSIQSTLLDISKRKQAEKALKESEEKFKAFTNQITEGVGVTDLDGNYVFVNPAFCQMSGYSYEELLNMTVFDLRADGQEQGTFEQSKSIKQGMAIQVNLKRKDKTEFLIEIVGSEIIINNEKFILGTVRDITERIEAENKVKESEKKYRNLFEIAQEGIWVIDANSQTTLVNKSMADILGYSEKEMSGKHLFDFMDEKGIEIAKENLERRKAGIKEQHDFEFITKKGNRIITTIETAPIFDDNNEYVGAIAGVIDITERKEAVKKLLESQALFNQVLDKTNAVIYIKDLDHKYMYINLSFEQLLDKSKEDILGKTDYELFPKKVVDQFLKNDNKVINGKYDIQIHEEIFHDNKVRTYISDKFPLFDSSGKLYATCGVSTDITDLLDAQQKEKLVQQQLVRKDRLIHAGHLAAAIAHEINNPMTVLHGSLEDLKKSKETLNEPILEEMLRVSRRIKRIISNLLIFTHQNNSNKQRVNINTIIKNTFLLVNSLLNKSSIEHILELSNNKLELEVDQVQIQQVFINIIFNAIFAMQHGGKLIVRSFKKDKHICISFEDNGIGIPEETLKSIFLPFFTTKDVGEGTGLGLSISHGIIKEHNGSISVESKINKGSVFTILLPIS